VFDWLVVVIDMAAQGSRGRLRIKQGAPSVDAPSCSLQRPPPHSAGPICGTTDDDAAFETSHALRHSAVSHELALDREPGSPVLLVGGGESTGDR
jgi:hypothetical protein